VRTVILLDFNCTSPVSLVYFAIFRCCQYVSGRLGRLDVVCIPEVVQNSANIMTTNTQSMKSKGPAPTVDQINADRITQVRKYFNRDLFCSYNM
jgi:hypothetical protein